MRNNLDGVGLAIGMLGRAFNPVSVMDMWIRFPPTSLRIGVVYGRPTAEATVTGCGVCRLFWGQEKAEFDSRATDSCSECLSL